MIPYLNGYYLDVGAIAKFYRSGMVCNPERNKNIGLWASLGISVSSCKLVKGRIFELPTTWYSGDGSYFLTTRNSHEGYVQAQIVKEL